MNTIDSRIFEKENDPQRVFQLFKARLEMILGNMMEQLDLPEDVEDSSDFIRARSNFLTKILERWNPKRMLPTYEKFGQESPVSMYKSELKEILASTINMARLILTIENSKIFNWNTIIHLLDNAQFEIYSEELKLADLEG